MSEITLPDLCLLVLVGVPGADTSRFARDHFRSTAVVSLGGCQGVVGEASEAAASDEAMALLRQVVGVRLRRGLLTVVDAAGADPTVRQELVRLARAHDVSPVAILLNAPERRADLLQEGFRAVHALDGDERIRAAAVGFRRLPPDRREATGPFDVIGDVHGCRSELETLLGALGYALDRDEAGRAVGAAHPAGRTAVFVGDLVDRGPDTPGVLRLVMGMVADGTALCVSGNHEHKLARALDGRDVRTRHGLAQSLAQLQQEDADFRARTADFCRALVSHYVLDGGRLVVAHAGLKEEYHGRDSERVRSFALYGQPTGETDQYGLPVRYPWARDYRGSPTVLYGHTPTPELTWVNRTLCLDTGVVFGGRLSALRYPELEPVSTPAEQVWYQPKRPLHVVDSSATSTRADPGTPPGVRG
jgi:hypothetical protein